MDRLERHLITVTELGKRFGRLEVLDGIDLRVDRGEVVAVLGTSGCGKSTLLRVVAGFEQPDHGEVCVAGALVKGPAPERGMVDQSSTLFPWLTLRRNVAWGPKAAGRRDPLAAADQLLRETGLEEFGDALPRQLSGGMRQRGAIAQVLANGPPVLLLDEPFAALDAQTRIRMHEWLRAILLRSPATVLLVTHDIDEALMLADRLVVLSARPAHVIAELPVTLGASRGRETLVDARFVRLKERVLALLF